LNVIEGDCGSAAGYRGTDVPIGETYSDNSRYTTCTRGKCLGGGKLSLN